MLKVTNLKKAFVQIKEKTITNAINDVSFEVPQGELFTLLGPSGCGKTTMLRCIAGLERPDSGEIKTKRKIVYSSHDNIFVQPNSRDIGMVFQSYAIWPHMNVFDNVAFPLRHGSKKYSRAEIRDKVERALYVVRLDGYASRESTKLSGGQQQRLALARAFVMEPDLLLLDEPLSNLDAKLREHMRFELKKLQKESGITTLYVTHDQIEALALSDKIGVIQEGRMVQRGTPQDIYEYPQSRFVADFIGTTNFISGEISRQLDNNGLYAANTEIGEMRVFSQQPLAPGARVVISVRPENIELCNEQTAAGDNVYEAVVDTFIFLGEFIDIQLKIGGVTIQTKTHPTTQVRENGNVYLKFDPLKCIAISDHGANAQQIKEESVS